ncbi:MAG: TrkA family potassium uptake protein [Chloroflexi bacterium]|nr:TrkA family potassium uptake protein [Chloroflexota bacterium]
MPTTRQIAVLGLGRFGQAVARELARLGHDVLAVDRDERIVQDLADDVTHAVQADITDPDALVALGLAEFDTVIVGVSESLEVSIMATVLLKRMGVQRVIAKAAHELHGSILEQLGVLRVVYPERETGFRVAHSFHAPGVQDYLDAAPGYGIARVALVERWVGRTLGDLDFPRSCSLTVLALARTDTVILNPAPAERLAAGDALIVAGLDEDLERIPDAAS